MKAVRTTERGVTSGRGRLVLSNLCKPAKAKVVGLKYCCEIEAGYFLSPHITYDVLGT